MTGNGCGFLQFLDAFLLIEVNHLTAQAVVARMLYHLHALVGRECPLLESDQSWILAHS